MQTEEILRVAKTQNMRETYHVFHSEREETTHSIDANNQGYPLKSLNSKDLLENNQIFLEFHINHTVRELISQFRKILKANGYKCVEMYEKQLLIVKLHFFDRLQKVFFCKEPPKFILSVTTHQFRSVRVVCLKPLQTSNSTFTYKQSNHSKILKETQGIAQYISQSKILIQGSNLPNQEEMSELDSDCKLDFYSLEATSYYMFSKMLIDKNYSIGKKMKALIQHFITMNQEPSLKRQSKENYMKQYEGMKSSPEIKEELYEKDASMSIIMQSMRAMKKEDLLYLNLGLNQISNEMLQGFNCSRKQLMEVLAYCRKSVEEFYYNSFVQTLVNEQSQEVTDSHSKNQYNTIIKNKQPIEVKSKQPMEEEIYCKDSKQEGKQTNPRKEELQQILPLTSNQLTALSYHSYSTMSIYRQLFMINHIFKWECEHQLHQNAEMKKHCLELIHQAYGDLIHQKVRMLKFGGYLSKDFEGFITQFCLEEEIDIEE